MVKHMILWQLKEELSDAERESVKRGIREGLESLIGKVPGLIAVHVQTEGLASSNADILLDSTLENEAALAAYAVHPEHVAVADGRVRPYTRTRLCMDYEC
ncbi:Dabb family protein [Lachnoclostridium sp. Marseille-P6806]|uniref:Dabb family protein n=1 Tax=Lachnoclostridium sp. Marseille-P6806 TaxID=2364793 RepID=UPI00102F9831|nr:Dabb family protein [Lachnoclostridium sp. Marseille-P6806]